MQFEALEPSDPQQVGPYRIVARLGGGGMGYVYLAQSRGGRDFAVKVIRPELARNDTFRRRFAREVASARRVNGAYTAGVVDADPEGSPAWLATAYVPGVGLDQAVAKRGPWPEEPTMALAAALAEALEAIHSAGVVHRDLKPSNVLLSADGPRVIDFGISLPHSGGTVITATGASITRTGEAIGTPGFMSPEQLMGDTVGPAGDVFSLGAVLTLVATGTGPFGTGSVAEVMFRVAYRKPRLEGVPPKLRDVVARCLAKDPEARPRVGALLDELAEHVNGGRKEGAAFTRAGWLPPAVARDVHRRSMAQQLLSDPTGTAAVPVREGAGEAADPNGTAADPVREEAGEAAHAGSPAGEAGSGAGAEGPVSGGATQEPASGGAAETPASTEAPQQPATGSATETPASTDATQKPATGSATEDPRAAVMAGDSRSAGADGEPDAAGAVQHPDPAGVAQESASAGTAEDPSPDGPVGTGGTGGTADAADAAAPDTGTDAPEDVADADQAGVPDEAVDAAGVASAAGAGWRWNEALSGTVSLLRRLARVNVPEPAGEQASGTGPGAAAEGPYLPQSPRLAEAVAPQPPETTSTESSATAEGASSDPAPSDVARTDRPDVARTDPASWKPAPTDPVPAGPPPSAAPQPSAGASDLGPQPGAGPSGVTSADVTPPDPPQPDAAPASESPSAETCLSAHLPDEAPSDPPSAPSPHATPPHGPAKRRTRSRRGLWVPLAICAVLAAGLASWLLVPFSAGGDHEGEADRPPQDVVASTSPTATPTGTPSSRSSATSSPSASKKPKPKPSKSSSAHHTAQSPPPPAADPPPYHHVPTHSTTPSRHPKSNPPPSGSSFSAIGDPGYPGYGTHGTITWGAQSVTITGSVTAPSGSCAQVRFDEGAYGDGPTQNRSTCSGTKSFSFTVNLGQAPGAVNVTLESGSGATAIPISFSTVLAPMG